MTSSYFPAGQNGYTCSACGQWVMAGTTHYCGSWNPNQRSLPRQPFGFRFFPNECVDHCFYQRAAVKTDHDECCNCGLWKKASVVGELDHRKEH